MHVNMHDAGAWRLFTRGCLSGGGFRAAGLAQRVGCWAGRRTCTSACTSRVCCDAALLSFCPEGLVWEQTWDPLHHGTVAAAVSPCSREASTRCRAIIHGLPCPADPPVLPCSEPRHPGAAAGAGAPRDLRSCARHASWPAVLRSLRGVHGRRRSPTAVPLGRHQHSLRPLWHVQFSPCACSPCCEP